MKKKFCAIILSLVLAACGLCGCGGNTPGGGEIILPPPIDDGDDYVSPYDVMGLGTIGFGVWGSPTQAYTTKKSYQQMVDGGFNFVEGFNAHNGDMETTKKALELCGELGLKFLPNCGEIATAISEYIKKPDDKLIQKAVDIIGEYYDYPAYAGQLLIDEPWATEFNGIDKFIKALDAQYPNNAWIVNMFPGVDFGYNSHDNTYEGYVDDWLDTNQKLYSFDFYPMTKDGTEASTYFYNLDLLRVKTRAKQIPLWSFAQTCESTFDKREPSEQDMRWNIFSNLAFGAKNIQYFTYWSLGGAYEDAIIDAEGNPTPRYEYVKKAHAEVAAYGDKLMRADAEGMMFCGSSVTGQHLYSKSLTEFGSFNGVTSNDCVVVGCFSDVKTKDKSLFLVADTPRDSSDVTLNFDSSVKSVTAYIKGEKVVKELTGGALNLIIDAGDAVYIEF